MNSKFILPGFVLMVLIQLFVPAKMIFDKENILKNGILYKFKAAPVDPNDPFIGKYVALNFEAVNYRYRQDMTWNMDDLAYVTLTTDSLGFAQIGDVYQKPPADEPFITATVQYTQPYENQLVIHYPFDRYYVEESQAPEIEKRYREAFQDSSKVAYALVAVKNGKAVLKELVIE